MNVSLYTKPRCEQSAATRAHMHRRHIRYTEHLLDEHTIRQLAAVFGIVGSPITVIATPDGDDASAFAGYRPDRIDQLARGVA